ncbi:MAG: hypothetical protein LBP72_08900 [Dysgonamonadaceae bacterium]|jgi:hypothetical protein|nr:hypothetical protein [Dysgonamonadaceae bacterium]
MKTEKFKNMEVKNQYGEWVTIIEIVEYTYGRVPHGKIREVNELAAIKL